MKIFLVFNSAAFGLKCQTGRQDSFGTNQTYELTDCPDDGQEWSCQNELRIHGSQYWAHTKGCKQTMACENNEVNNFHLSGKFNQCKPGSTNSVCRCCCESDACNDNDYFCLDEIRHCPPLKTTHALQFECTDGTKENSECSFQCRSNYVLNGNSNIQCIVDFDGTMWSKNPPTCEEAPEMKAENKCPEIFADENLSMMCTDNKDIAESKCHFKCPAGFELVGESVSICNFQSTIQSAIQWSSSPPTCKRTTCPKLVKLENGELSCSGNKFEDLCSFICNDGYIIDGSETMSCLGNSRWSQKYPKCSVIPKKQTTKTPVTTEADTTKATVTTKTQTTETPVITKTQTTDTPAITKTYVEKVPKAIAQCTEIQHFIVESDCTSGAFVGSVCDFQCPSGYSLAGPASAECMPSLLWSESVPDCTFKLMIQKWVVTEAIKQNSNWKNYFKIDDNFISGRTGDEGSADDLIEVILNAQGCPDNEMISELLAYLSLINAEDSQYEEIEAVLNNLCLS